MNKTIMWIVIIIIIFLLLVYNAGAVADTKAGGNFMIGFVRQLMGIGANGQVASYPASAANAKANAPG